MRARDDDLVRVQRHGQRALAPGTVARPAFTLRKHLRINSRLEEVERNALDHPFAGGVAGNVNLVLLAEPDPRSDVQAGDGPDFNGGDAAPGGR